MGCRSNGGAVNVGGDPPPFRRAVGLGLAGLLTDVVGGTVWTLWMTSPVDW